MWRRPGECSQFSDSLRTGRSGDRTPTKARFFLSVQTPRPTNWHRVCLPGVKRPGRGVNHPPPSSAEVKECVELYLYFPPPPGLCGLFLSCALITPVSSMWLNSNSYSAVQEILCCYETGNSSSCSQRFRIELHPEPSDSTQCALSLFLGSTYVLLSSSLLVDI
jgi:hypothetical protein